MPDAPLAALGCEVTELDLTVADPGETAATLSRSALVFVTGGSPIYLLECAQKSGFIELVSAGVRNGDFGYVGVSAGAALAGPSMEPLAAGEDPGKVADFSALRLVDFVTLPHVNRYPPDVFEARREHWAKFFSVRSLADNRALAIDGDEVVEVESE